MGILCPTKSILTMFTLAKINGQVLIPEQHTL